nr:hypothetical protein [Candidatus Sigynarchaeum springense]MDO8117694.1 hypothetical protein [Candidatus Sigynarchaeota archaeon]
MGMMALVTLNIFKRDIEDIWENLQLALVSDAYIEALATGIVFETYGMDIQGVRFSRFRILECEKSKCSLYL